MTIPVTLVNNFGERMEGEINPKALTLPVDNPFTKVAIHELILSSGPS